MIPLFRVAMHPAIGSYLTPLLISGYIGQGKKVEEFEDALEPWVGSRPVTTSSGTMALTIALRLAGVGPDTYVITTPMTCSATNEPILSLGAHPIWADIDPRTGLIDPESVAERVLEARANGQHVKAIIAVDWGGQPCDYDALIALGAEYGIPTIADAAHSFGATYKEIVVGRLALYTAFSFQAIKTLTAGDGGALTIVGEKATQRARDMRWFGISRDDPSVPFRGALDITEWGYKGHMNDINATIGLVNLDKVGETLAFQRAAAATYDRLLSDRLIRTAPFYQHEGAWWMYTTLLESSDQREAFRLHMEANEIQVSQVHWRNDDLTIFAPYKRKLPGVDLFTSRMICLPTHRFAEPERVAEAANEFFDG